MPRRVRVMELRDIVHRLRLGQSVKAIHRETGRHKTVIRAVRDLAARQGWLNLLGELPSEGEIGRRYQEQGPSSEEQPHLLQTVEEPITEWLKEGNSFQVIHRLLLQRGIEVSESTVRRWIHRRFPRLPKPVIVRATIPGEAMEVDFGYLGVFREQSSGRLRKAWFFSGRLRHSRRVYREVVLEQNQGTFFRCRINAFEFFGGVPLKVVPDNLKAAVVRASLEAPLVNRAYRSLAEHYGFLISPCPPARLTEARPGFARLEAPVLGKELRDPEEVGMSQRVAELEAGDQDQAGVGRQVAEMLDRPVLGEGEELQAVLADPTQENIEGIHPVAEGGVGVQVSLVPADHDAAAPAPRTWKPQLDRPRVVLHTDMSE
jgi:hypothetical protein